MGSFLFGFGQQTRSPDGALWTPRVILLFFILVYLFAFQRIVKHLLHATAATGRGHTILSAGLLGPGRMRRHTLILRTVLGWSLYYLL